MSSWRIICMSVLLAPLPLGLRRFDVGNRRRCNRGGCDWRGMSGRTRYHYPRGLRARGAACKRHEGDVPRTLNRYAQPALVPRAHAGHPARQNFPALLHELRQDVRALVVDEVHLLHAELANLLLAEILPLPARPSARTTRSAWASAAFAPRSAMSAAVPAVATFTPRSSSRRRCLFLFFCHTFHPFTSCPASAGVSSSESKKTGIALVLQAPHRKASLSRLLFRAPVHAPLEEPPSGADAVRRASRASA